MRKNKISKTDKDAAVSWNLQECDHFESYFQGIEPTVARRTIRDLLWWSFVEGVDWSKKRNSRGRR